MGAVSSVTLIASGWCEGAFALSGYSLRGLGPKKIVQYPGEVGIAFDAATLGIARLDGVLYCYG